MKARTKDKPIPPLGLKLKGRMALKDAPEDSYLLRSEYGWQPVSLWRPFLEGMWWIAIRKRPRCDATYQMFAGVLCALLVLVDLVLYRTLGGVVFLWSAAGVAACMLSSFVLAYMEMREGGRR